ncbi:hypothetical protein DFH06DRAFT_687043 [Mycena polygramma]|nr:hypothetical protein DFH06DRAFT_687043 [Mycena polygramma]
MPRVYTTPIQRPKREAQQRTTASLPGRCNGHRIASTSNAANESISASDPFPHAPPIAAPLEVTWRHPDELSFITDAETWDRMAIARFIRASAISVPPRPAKTTEAWILVRCADGSEVSLPRGYRIPLLWVSKFLWLSVQLVLSTPGEWALKRFDVLHVARLIDTLVSGARAAIDGGGIDKHWRCGAFDRALWRYWHRWLVMRDESVEAFWNEFGEGVFEPDVLKQGWAQWVIRGSHGFPLTKDEVNNGLSEAEFVHGFVLDEKSGRIAWVRENTSAGQADVPLVLPAAADESVSGVGTSSRLRPEYLLIFFARGAESEGGCAKSASAKSTSTVKPKPSAPATAKSTSTVKPKPSAQVTTSTTTSTAKAKPKAKPKVKTTSTSTFISTTASASKSATPNVPVPFLTPPTPNPTESWSPLTIHIPAAEQKPVETGGRPCRKRKPSARAMAGVPPSKKGRHVSQSDTIMRVEPASRGVEETLRTQTGREIVPAPFRGHLIFDPDVTLEESDLGEDLQVLYPESSPVQTRTQLQPYTRESGAMPPVPSPNELCSSSSRSPSPRIPSMSSARFSSPSA